MKKRVPIPIQKSQSLQALQRTINDKLSDIYNIKKIIDDLKDGPFIEYAWLMLKQARLDPLLWVGLKPQLNLLAEKIRIKQMHRQRVNPCHLLFWLRFKVTAPAYVNNHATLQYLLGQTLMDAGLPVAMGLEKTPRLAVKLGCHLPLLVEGYNEWADVTLIDSIETSLASLPTLINYYTPKGICALEVIQVHNHASSVADLCHRAHWQWTHNEDEELLDHISQKLDAFIKSKKFNIEKPTKVNGKHSFVQVDIRPLFENCIWDGYSLKFQTVVIPGQAANPSKMLATILGITTPLSGLVRTKLELREDLRALQADKFGIKLHNMYEDAIVLDTVVKRRTSKTDDKSGLLQSKTAQ